MAGGGCGQRCKLPPAEGCRGNAVAISHQAGPPSANNSTPPQALGASLVTNTVDVFLCLSLQRRMLLLLWHLNLGRRAPSCPLVNCCAAPTPHPPRLHTHCCRALGSQQAAAGLALPLAVISMPAGVWTQRNAAWRLADRQECRGRDCVVYKIIECRPPGAPACQRDSSGNVGFNLTGACSLRHAPCAGTSICVRQSCVCVAWQGASQLALFLAAS